MTRFLLHGDAASVMFFFVCDLGSRAGAVGHGRVSSFPPALPALEAGLAENGGVGGVLGHSSGRARP